MSSRSERRRRLGQIQPKRSVPNRAAALLPSEPRAASDAVKFLEWEILRKTGMSCHAQDCAKYQWSLDCDCQISIQ